MKFQKWQGTGNDFIFVYDPEATLQLSQKEIAMLCHRRFGIGADGFIAWQLKDGTPFMKYYNSDGRESTMCGNGGRCFAAYSVYNELTAIDVPFYFNAVDGSHEARIQKDAEGLYRVELKMSDVAAPEHIGPDTVINTGSPHYIVPGDAAFLEQDSIVDAARAIRNNERFRAEGINVNFVYADAQGHLHMRTYERGVEDETYSCGTGVTAAALAFYPQLKNEHVYVRTPGGNLEVHFKPLATGFEDVWLIGPAALVFEGSL